MKHMVVPQLFGRHHLLNSISHLGLAVATVAAGAQMAHAADVRPTVVPGAQNSHLTLGASHLSDGQFRLGVEGDFARRVSLMESKSADDAQFLSETGASRAFLSYGLSDKLSLHLETSATRHIQKMQDDVKSEESRQWKNAGSTVGVQYVFTDDASFWNSGVSVYGKSGAGKAGQDSLVRDEKGSYGFVLGNSLGTLSGSHLSLDLGMQFKNAKDDQKFDETQRLHGSLMGYINLLDSVQVFTGLNGQEIRTGSKTKIYGANYLYGIGYKVSGLDVSAFGSYGLKFSSFGTTRQEGGLSLSYTFGEKPASMAKMQPVKKSKKLAKKASAKKGDKFADSGEEDASIEKLVNSLPKHSNVEDMDEFELQELREKEEAKKYGTGLTEWEKVEKDLNEIKAAEAAQKAADEQAAKEQERVDRANSVKQAKEDAKRQKVLEEEVSGEVNKLEGVSDDESNWQGLD